MTTAGLVLDFDGTVLDTELPVYRSWAELWEEHGHELPLARWQSIIGTVDGFDPAAELEARLGSALLEEALARRRARRDELLHALDLRAGIDAWLDEADALAVPVAIASSSPSEWVDGHLARLDLLHRFAFVACAGDGVPGKPDPEVYRVACAAIGADPARSVAVEDSPHGVAAAVAAGLYTVAVPHDLTSDLDLSAADVVMPSLAALSLEEALARAAVRAPRACPG